MEDREKQELTNMLEDQESFKGTMEDINNQVKDLVKYDNLAD